MNVRFSQSPAHDPTGDKDLDVTVNGEPLLAVEGRKKRRGEGSGGGYSRPKKERVRVLDAFEAMEMRRKGRFVEDEQFTDEEE